VIFKNPHIQTIFPALFAQGKFVYRRETIETPDADFLDLDFFNEGHSKLIVFIHGMESNSEDNCIRRSLNFLKENNFSILIINLRGCGGKLNRHFPRSYHSGLTQDLNTVLEHISSSYSYQEIYLIGLSIGGNIVLKYLGEKTSRINPKIKKAISISAPINLRSSADALAKPANQIYMRHLLDKLGSKLKANLNHLKTFHEYDNLYTAPLHGFKDAEDYWTQASAKPKLKDIRIPTLIISALDDPFLGPECFPSQQDINPEYISLYQPNYGGHLGFVDFDFKIGIIPRLSIKFSLEKQILDFLK